MAGPHSPALCLVFLLSFLSRSLSQSPPCPAGHYAHIVTYNPRNETCIPCPAGTYLPTSGALHLDLCIECPPNTFSTVLGATSRFTCTPCPPGKASRSGANACLRCRPGTRIQPCPFPRHIQQIDVSMEFFRGDCFFYPDGPDPFVSRFGPQTLRCERCPRDSVSAAQNSLTCEFCRNGLVPNAERTMCVTPSCRPVHGAASVECRQCSTGLTLDLEQGTCVPCPNGQVASLIQGVFECRPCQEGTARIRNSVCSSCAEGENRNVTGAQFCLPPVRSCADNFFRAEGGSCHKCTKRQRYDARINACVSCPTNSISKGGLDTRCRRCRRGMHLPSSSSTVCSCEKGWGWVPGSGRTRCERCPPGTSSTGGQFCTPCAIDQFGPTPGLSICDYCGDTETQPRYGQRRCVRRRCPRGLVPSGHAGCVLPTTNCPPDHDRDSDVGLLPICVPRSAASCPSGTVITRAYFDTPTCGTCGRGQMYNRTGERCVSCPTGTTSDGGIVETCEPCPRGLQFIDGRCRCIGARKLVRGRCVRCPRGTFGFPRVDGCLPCPIGTASNSVGRLSSCDACPAGKFAANPGSTDCQDCPEGSTTFGIRESGCFQLG